MDSRQPLTAVARRLALPALVLAGLVMFVSAGRAGPQAAPASAAPTPTFKASTQLVQVDVMVHGRGGHFVTDLTRGDFKLTEDGKPQAIETFALVGVPGGAATAHAGLDGGAQATKQPAHLPAARPIFVFVFDNEHLGIAPFKNVQRAMETFIRHEFTGRSIGGIVAYGGLVNGHVTSKGRELLNIVRSLKARPSLMELGAQASTDSLLRTLAALMTGLAKFPGAKSVVFVSDGFSSTNSLAAIQRVVGLAARSRTRIYSLDARGLSYAGDNLRQGTVGPYTDPIGGLPAAPTFESDQNGPNSLAIDTGGFVVRHTNDFAGALQHIADDSRTYYLLGYRPTNANFKGRFRKIKVTVDRRGVVVRARKGYLGLPLPR